MSYFTWRHTGEVLMALLAPGQEVFFLLKVVLGVGKVLNTTFTMDKPMFVLENTFGDTSSLIEVRKGGFSKGFLKIL